MAAELALFEVGRSLGSIRDALDGRGNYEFGYADPLGDAVVGVSFAVCEEPGPLAASRDVVWAIFRNEQFVKFVDWVKPEIETVPYKGTTASRLKQQSVSDNLTRAFQAADADPLPVAQLVARIEGPAAPRNIDWGMTVAVAPLAPLIRGRIESSLGGNADLRCRYWGGHAGIGEARGEVEERLGAPLEEWSEDGRDICVYGPSAVADDLLFGLRVSDVLVAYRDGVVEIVYSYEFLRSIVAGI